MNKKTKDYEMFIFRSDNREAICQNHVKKLMESIKARNLLELAPILVNEKMEIIDGQHRVLAAKALGVEIFYKQDMKLHAEDIIRMNVSKSWKMMDYLNFYVHHKYDEYLKLKEFMKVNNVTLKIALNMVMGPRLTGYTEFKNGKFIFNEENLGNQIEICWESIEYIKKMNGYSLYTSTGRFWKALLKLVNHPSFDPKKWRSNMQKMVHDFKPMARTEDYLSCFEHIYNYRSGEKLYLRDTI